MFKYDNGKLVLVAEGKSLVVLVRNCGAQYSCELIVNGISIAARSRDSYTTGAQLAFREMAYYKLIEGLPETIKNPQSLISEALRQYPSKFVVIQVEVGKEKLL